MSDQPTIDVYVLTESELQQKNRDAIRAFIERVEKRLPDYDTGRGADAMLKAYRQAVYDELNAMGESE
jgi:type IV pilus biogenesis protein CpaD/CtpE